LQWLQDTGEINGYNVNYIRRLASRYFTSKKREYQRDKIDELATNSKNKNIRELYRRINEYKKCCQPRSNLVKDGNVDLLVDSHNFMNRWKTAVMLHR
jgi:hypothetical protein